VSYRDEPQVNSSEQPRHQYCGPMLAGRTVRSGSSCVTPLMTPTIDCLFQSRHDRYALARTTFPARKTSLRSSRGQDVVAQRGFHRLSGAVERIGLEPNLSYACLVSEKSCSSKELAQCDSGRRTRQEPTRSVPSAGCHKRETLTGFLCPRGDDEYSQSAPSKASPISLPVLLADPTGPVLQ